MPAYRLLLCKIARCPQNYNDGIIFELYGATKQRTGQQVGRLRDNTYYTRKLDLP